MTKRCAILLAASLVASCDTPRKVAFRRLSELGVEPSGRSLVKAVLDGRKDQVSLLLEAGIHSEQRDSRGRTPLAIAVEKRDIALAMMLLNAGAEVNATLPNGSGIIGIALEYDDTRMVETLLASGSKTDGLMPDGDPTLPWAIRRGKQDLVRQMMLSGADPHMKDRFGNPLLHVAMECGRRDLVDALVKLGADASATNAAGESTIHVALKQGWRDMIPTLAAAGADPNAASPDGSTFLEKALAQDDVQTAALFLKIGADPNLKRDSKTKSPFSEVFERGSTQMLATFLNSAATPPGGDWDPWFRSAYHKRDLTKSAMLLSHGIRPQPTRHLLPVESAVLDGRRDFTKLLMDYGLPAGKSVFIASARGDHEMLGILLTCGAAADITLLPTFDTPLSIAVRAGHDKVAETLIQHGADPTKRITEGQSIFHLAIAKGCHRTVGLLLESGISPNTPFTLPVSPAFLKQVRPGVMRWVLKMDRNGTPLMLAADSGNIPTTRLLIKAGANRNARTRTSSLWPINFAVRRNDVAMARLILGRDPRREERRIEISLSEQRARIYDADGNEILNTRVSTGRKGFATPTGEFVITDKNRDWTSTLYHASMPYFQRLNCADFGLHEGVVPNYPASHGCIRVPAGTAAKIFSLTKTGDRVTIVP